MTLTGIAARNIGRNKLRTTLTVTVVAIVAKKSFSFLGSFAPNQLA